MKTQEIYKEMREIDNKIMRLQKTLPKNLKEKYYVCPECGNLSTYSQQIEEASQGGLPYCYCEFGGDRGRVFIGYKRINKKLWEELKELKTDKLRLKEYRKYKLDKIRGKK